MAEGWRVEDNRNPEEMIQYLEARIAALLARIAALESDLQSSENEAALLREEGFTRRRDSGDREAALLDRILVLEGELREAGLWHTT